MIFIYLVLGCWLKFIFPEYAYLTDTLWFCAAYFVTAISVLGAILLLKTKGKGVSVDFGGTAWPRVFLLLISGLLTGHAITALVMFISLATFVKIEHFYGQNKPGL